MMPDAQWLKGVGMRAVISPAQSTEQTRALRGRRGSTFPISPGFTVSVVSIFRIMKLEFLKLSNFPKSQLKTDGSRMTERTGVSLVYAF